MNNDFLNYYKDVLLGINNCILEYDKKVISDKTGYLKENLQLFDNLNELGKRIRGTLVTLGYKIASKKEISYSYPLALAYELFETSVLIHDDVIDCGDVRRGIDTIHYSNYIKYKYKDEDDAKKVSESLAICMGDYGFYLANKVLINAYSKDNNFSKILDYYNDIVLKTIEGELIDVELSFIGKYFNDDSNLKDNIMNVYRLKTAYYTIVGPICLGLMLGGIDDEKIKKISAPFEKIGIAFQIQDDILGIYNDMGKDNCSDIREYKQTILFSYIMENKLYKDELLKYYGNKNITMDDVLEVRKIFKESGAYDYAFNMMNDLYDQSIKEIDSIDWMEIEDKNLLFGFVDYLRKRNK